jgi:acyl transferase domain-containing protein
MAAIGLGQVAASQYLETGVVVACENSPQSVVISGDKDVLFQVMDRILQERPDTFTAHLDVETAYHSR